MRMTRRTVVLLGDPSLSAPLLNRLVQEFGWALETAADLNQLERLCKVGRPVAMLPVAVLVDAASQGLEWTEALNSVRGIEPEALLVACHRFSDRVEWPELAAAGAFHSLAAPFDEHEVRQSLAFIWSACFRRSKNVVAIPQVEPAQTFTGRKMAAPLVMTAKSVA